MWGEDRGRKDAEANKKNLFRIRSCLSNRGGRGDKEGQGKGSGGCYRVESQGECVALLRRNRMVKNLLVPSSGRNRRRELTQFMREMRMDGVTAGGQGGTRKKN